MDLEPVLPFCLAFLSLLSFQLGMSVRARVHVLVPWKDPVTLGLMLIAFSPVIADMLGHHIVDTTNIWYLSFLAGFVCCYTLAYVRGEFSVVYVAVQTISSPEFPNGAEHIKPMVYYYHDDQLYLQEQSFKEILKTVFLGLRSPLDFPMDRIYRTNPVYVQKIYFPLISLDKVDVVYEEISEELITKFHLKFKVRSYRYTAAPYCTDAGRTWMVNRANQDAMQRQMIRDQSALFNAKQEAMTGRIAQAADIVVDLMSDHTPEGDVFEDLKELYKPASELRVPEDREPEVKRRSVIPDPEGEDDE